MDILHLSSLGWAFPSGVNKALIAMAFGTGGSGQKYVIQVLEVDANGKAIVIMVRGRQLLLDANVVQGYSSRNTSISEADLTVLAESTDGNGFLTPTAFVTPDGWVKSTVNGDTFYTLHDAAVTSALDTNNNGIPDDEERAAPVGFIAKTKAWILANKEISVVIGLVVLFLGFVKKKKTGTGKGKTWFENNV